MRQFLSLESLPDFDNGKAQAAWQHALKQVVMDLLSRPGERAARTVTLTCAITPIAEQGGDVVDADVAFEIKTKTPAMKTAPKPMATDRQGRLFFNDMAPDNPYQQTIDEASNN